MTQAIDLRSDTVTRPSAAMRSVMHDAPVGDDVFGDDPTVNRLQATLAERLGFEAGLFCASGTQSNLTALMAHCQRGDEYIVGQEAHTYRYEAGGAAVLGSIQPQPISNQPDGSLALADIASAIKPDDVHFARSRLLALENTIGGKVLPLSYLEEAGKLAKSRGLNFHLDGARMFNAAVKLGVSGAELCNPFDSVSVCLSKGLGAPIGSVLCGSRELIKDAHRWRKMLGGGMRQAGVLAAAGLFALEYNVDRLAEDHENAANLARGLAEIAELRLEPVQTNIVYAHVPAERCEALRAHLAQRGIIALIGPKTRLVTHLDVSATQIQQVIAEFKTFFA